ncbi:MAG: DUF4843 domain-containing protein [Candidatus Pedobacter colombiensis]|uniref:DUF4843 domain-containing protein n=1 Tax=Candidatus Pedobacter colombiensis TaxID=3121371 RepID=A0AAJ5W4P2_9SPHI|nr:DUF4843 domain-containing protein [Pedobacter sp.]WEK17525.1 MAG: DUF4843 domain-containing protein [Pedobacter sp.]
MKTNMIYLLLISVTSLFFSCKKATELRYSDTDAINVWLGVNDSRPDSLEYNYAFKSLNEVDSILFKAKLTGKLADHDRTFFLKAIAGDTTRLRPGTHYTFGKYVIKANTYQAIFPIYIKRSADFKTRSARIVFAVSDQGELKKGLTEMTTMTVVFKDAFAKPANWDVDIYPYTKLSTYFGAYSNVKFQFITTAIGQPPIFRVLSAGTPALGEVNFTEVKFYQNSCKQQLAVYNAAHPTDPMKDENNQIITFP